MAFGFLTAECGLAGRGRPAYSLGMQRGVSRLSSLHSSLRSLIWDSICVSSRDSSTVLHGVLVVLPRAQYSEVPRLEIDLGPCRGRELTLTSRKQRDLWKGATGSRVDLASSHLISSRPWRARDHGYHCAELWRALADTEMGIEVGFRRRPTRCALQNAHSSWSLANVPVYFRLLFRVRVLARSVCIGSCSGESDSL